MILVWLLPTVSVSNEPDLAYYSRSRNRHSSLLLSQAYRSVLIGAGNYQAVVARAGRWLARMCLVLLVEVFPSLGPVG
jgi:hypothetical protein